MTLVQRRRIGIAIAGLVAFCLLIPFLVGLILGAILMALQWGFTLGRVKLYFWLNK